MTRRSRHREPVAQVEWDWQGTRYRFGLAANGQLFANPPVNVRVQRVYDSLIHDGDPHPAVALFDRFAHACRGVYVASDGSRSEAQYLAYRTAGGEFIRIVTNFGEWIARAQERHRQRTGEMAGLPLHLPADLPEGRSMLFYMPESQTDTIILAVAAAPDSTNALSQSWRVTGDGSPRYITPSKRPEDVFARTVKGTR